MSNLLYNTANIEYRRLKSTCIENLGFSVAETVDNYDNECGWRRVRMFKDHLINGICDTSTWLELEMIYEVDGDNHPTCLFEARAYTIENCRLQDMQKHSEECILDRKIKVHTPIEVGHAVNLILGLIDVDGVLGILG